MFSSAIVISLLYEVPYTLSTSMYDWFDLFVWLIGATISLPAVCVLTKLLGFGKLCLHSPAPLFRPISVFLLTRARRVAADWEGDREGGHGDVCDCTRIKVRQRGFAETTDFGKRRGHFLELLI